MALTTTPSELTATALTITTAAQPNITSVGTLTGLTVSGNIAGTLTTAAQPNITSVGTISSLTVSGNTQAASFTAGTANANSELLYLLGSGHTGHGASNTVSLVSIAESTSGNTMGLWLGSMTNENTAVIGTRTATGNIAFQTHSGGWGERMRITYDGNVGIGTSSVSLGSTDLVLQVGSSSHSTPTIQIRSSTTGTGQLWFGDNSGTDVGRYDGYIEYGQTNRYMAFGTANTTALLIDSSQRGLFGHTSSQSFVWTSVQPKLQVEGTDASSASMSITRNSANGSPPYLILAKSRGAAVNSNTTVVDDDVTGEIMFVAADGTNKETRTATIYSAVDGTPGSDDMPGRLVFGTTQDGNYHPTTAITIDSSQQTIFSGNVTATTSGAGVLLANSLNAHVGTDRGSQVSLFANSSGNTFHAGHTITWNTGANDGRTGKMFLNSTGKLGLGVDADADYQFKVYSGDYYTQKLRAPNYPVLAFEAININSGNNGRISVGADNKFVLQTANAAGNTAIVMHDGKLGASGGSDFTPDVALDVQGPLKIRANSAGGVSQTYTNMTAANSGKIIINFAAIGTMATDDTIVFTYAATAWKSWFFKIRWSSTGGYMGELWAGGYNNNSNGYTIANPKNSGDNDDGTSQTSTDGATLSVSRSGQANTMTLTLTAGHVHPLFEIEYACGGGEGYPLASRCSLSVNS